jgi:hypothetical protein
MSKNGNLNNLRLQGWPVGRGFSFSNPKPHRLLVRSGALSSAAGELLVLSIYPSFAWHIPSGSAGRPAVQPLPLPC